MKHAFKRAGVLSAALAMFVSASAPAFARHHIHWRAFHTSWKHARFAHARHGLGHHAGGGVIRASWYGGGEKLNSHTASGQRFNPHLRTAAHRTLPLGTKARVVNMHNGRSTLVVINDRGPAAWTGRSLDLSRQAALDLGMIHNGETQVKMEIVR
jgi:rare lipoprotein A